MAILRQILALLASSRFLRREDEERWRAVSLPARRAGWSIALIAASCFWSTGCTSMLLDKKVDVKNVFGPIGRKAREAVEIQERDPLAPIEGTDEFDAAKALYDKKDYPAARKAFAAVAKKYKDKAIEEEAMFMIAESDYQMQHFADAQDSYDELFKKYPSTRYLEESTKRLFTIARYWLDQPKPASEVELAHFTRSSPETKLEEIPDARVPFVFPLTPNFFDKTRPLFDAQGRALQALRSVWINDPTGPLADDALMMAATHHLRKRDYQEADHYFSTIREQYADREHAASAYVLGQHASYSSYQGAKYDVKQLDEARKLTDSVLRLYPNLPQKKKLTTDLERMNAEAAERDWVRVNYYLKRGEKDSAAVYAELLLKDYPDAPRSDEARKLLLELGPDYSQGVLPKPLYKAPSIPVKSDDDSEGKTGTDEPPEPGRVHLSDDELPIPEGE